MVAFQGMPHALLPSKRPLNPPFSSCVGLNDSLLRLSGTSSWLKRKLRACAETDHLGTDANEASQHDPGHRKRDESLTARVRALKIARKATMMRNPGVGAFHHPSLGE